MCYNTMLLYDKKFLKFLVFCLVYILLTAFFFISKKPPEAIWLSNWFFDKFFIFQFSTIYLLGCSMLEKYFNYMSFNRMGSRKKILTNQLILQYCFAFIYTNMLFVCIIIGSLIMFGRPEGITILNILNWYLRYLLGLFLLTNLSMLFRVSKNNFLNIYSQFLTFLILSLELIAITPQIRKLFFININIMFSWVFYKNKLISYFGLLAINLICAIYLFKINSRKDLTV